MNLNDYVSFNEWWHYLILMLWIILLLFLLRYFKDLESFFKTKDEKTSMSKQGRNFLIISFVLGIAMVLVWMLKPAHLTEQNSRLWWWIQIGFYAAFLILIAINAMWSIKNYTSKSSISRIILMSLLMVIYFYTGMFGGLFVMALFALAVIIYFIIKFKKILSIK